MLLPPWGSQTLLVCLESSHLLIASCWASPRSDSLVEEDVEAAEELGKAMTFVAKVLESILTLLRLPSPTESREVME